MSRDRVGAWRVVSCSMTVTVTGIGLGTIYGYVKEIMIIIIASQDGIVR